MRELIAGAEALQRQPPLAAAATVAIGSFFRGAGPQPQARQSIQCHPRTVVESGRGVHAHVVDQAIAVGIFR